MNDARPQRTSVASSGMALMGSQYGLTAISALFTIVLLRLLTKTQFAVVAVLEILTSFASFTEAGLNSVFLQKAPRGLERGDPEAVGYIKLALMTRAVLLAVLSLILLLAARPLSLLFLKTPEYTGHLRLLVLGVVANAFMESLIAVAQSAQDFKLIARWTLISGISRQTVSIALYLVFGFWGYLAGFTGTTALNVLGLAWSLRHILLGHGRPAPLLATLRYSFPFYLRTFFRFGFMHFDQAAVGALLTPSALANYAVARRVSRYITVATSALQDPILTRAAAIREEPPEVRGAFARRGMRWVGLVVVPLALAVAVSGPFLLRVLAGGKYASTWPLLALLAIGQIAYALYGNLGLHVFVIRPPWCTLLLDGVVGVISYGAAPVLIHFFGVYGMAAGQIVAFLIGLGVAAALLRPFPELQPDGSEWKLLALPLLAALVPIICLQALHFSMWVAPVYYVLGAALFVWVLARRLPEPELEMISGRIPGWLKVRGRGAR